MATLSSMVDHMNANVPDSVYLESAMYDICIRQCERLARDFSPMRKVMH
jgi:hypothetical protein